MLVNLINYVGVSFPVTEIEAISFYKGSHLVAACFCENGIYDLNNKCTDCIYGVCGLSCAIYDVAEYTASTEAQVEGRDLEGNPFALHCNLKHIQQNYHA